MRATGQARNLTGPLDPEEAQVVVARAILGEWLGGSGGGWQDSGGIFPGIKLIQGVAAAEGDPEWGVSRGRLLPAHRLLERPTPRTSRGDAGMPEPFPEALAESLVLVHGGMAQNVGPILNMVTTKYLLREPRRVAGPAGGPARSSTRSSRPSQAADVRALGRADDPELGRAAQADHPLGDQRVHRVDHRARPARRWATTSGAS